MEEIEILEPYDDVEIWTPVTEPYEGRDAQLPLKVRNIRMDYPFGSSTMYPINPCTTLKELIVEIQRVFRSLWDAGLSDAPHEIEDFVIEMITPHHNGIATVIIGS